jgi:hypothetical protein
MEAKGWWFAGSGKKTSVSFPAPCEESSLPFNWETGLSLFGYLLTFLVHKPMGPVRPTSGMRMRLLPAGAVPSCCTYGRGGHEVGTWKRKADRVAALIYAQQL